MLLEAHSNDKFITVQHNPGELFIYIEVEDISKNEKEFINVTTEQWNVISAFVAIIQKQ
jgi:hypothetical protein